MDRRSFLRGLIAAPAVVAAAHIMPVRLPLILRPTLVTGNILTIQMITREAIRLFANSNSFIEQIDAQYTNQTGDLQWPMKLAV